MARSKTAPRHTATPDTTTSKHGRRAANHEHHSVFEDRSVLDALWSAVVAAPTSVMPPAAPDAVDLESEPAPQAPVPPPTEAPTEAAPTLDGAAAANPVATNPGAASAIAENPAAGPATATNPAEASPAAHPAAHAPAAHAPAAGRAAGPGAPISATLVPAPKPEPEPFVPILGRPTFPTAPPPAANPAAAHPQAPTPAAQPAHTGRGPGAHAAAAVAPPEQDTSAQADPAHAPTAQAGHTPPAAPGTAAPSTGHAAPAAPLAPVAQAGTAAHAAPTETTTYSTHAATAHAATAHPAAGAHAATATHPAAAAAAPVAQGPAEHPADAERAAHAQAAAAASGALAAGMPGAASPTMPPPATHAAHAGAAQPGTAHAGTAQPGAAQAGSAGHPPRVTGPFDLSYAAAPSTNRTIWAGPRHAAPLDWNSTSALLTIETPAAVSDAGLLVMRLVVGLTMAAHGAQKAFGLFGGDGFAATADGFSALGYQPGALFALAAIVGELFGGLFLAAGLLTPLAAGGIIGVTVNAMVAVNLGNGFFASHDGIELPLILSGAALGLLLAGPGRYSVDSRIPFFNGAAVQCVAAGIALLAMLTSLGAHLL